MWKPRAKIGARPLTHAPYSDVERIMTNLRSYDRDQWAKAFSEAAEPYEEKGRAAEGVGDLALARENYLRAYGLYHLGRFPTTNSAGKLGAYRKSQEMFAKIVSLSANPPDRLVIPFSGRFGEGSSIIAYLYRPRGHAPFPLLVIWGGIDGYKEDRGDLGQILDRGIAVLSMDCPGVGDSPLKGSEDAERMFGAVFDWIRTRDDLNANKVAAWGISTGGYWATKVAHTNKDMVSCVVSQGGCAHYAFEKDWICKAEKGEYPFELAETLAYAFGRSTFEEWVDYAPKLSLLRQGILDRPSAPLLLVNGIHDSVFPINDCYLLLEHGSEKSARFFNVGHGGQTEETIPIILNWMSKNLAK